MIDTQILNQHEETIQRDLELGKRRISKFKETMQERNALPWKMDRHFHRNDYKNGELTIIIRDAAHFADALAFAQQNDKMVDFDKAIMRLIRVALGGAIPQPECTWADNTYFDAIPGRERKIEIYPDSHSEPSFGFHEEKGLTGGLIWHHRSGSWSIHT